MPQTHLLVFDLETVPDDAILPSDQNPESFPKPIQHRIVSLGFLLVRIHRDGEYERYEVRRLGTASLNERSEREILAGFWQIVDKHQPRVVTWNGRGFDAPVLKQRSLIHGLAAYNWHRTEPRFGYDYRYESRWHCDLMDVLCDYGASSRLGLDEAAVALGLPGKLEGHGSEVGKMLAAGDYDRINRYCEGDVLNTYLLYLRWACLSSRVSPWGHNASVRHLVEYLEHEQAERPHLGAFLETWRGSPQPCPLYVAEPDKTPDPQPMEAHLRSEDVLH
jgi:predicted PolB exonuclease-like 3'-5' exonuclease